MKPLTPSPRRQRGAVTAKIVGALILVAIIAVAYKAYTFYQSKVAPVVEGVAQATAVVAGAAKVIEKLNPFEMSRDPTEVAKTLKDSFGIAPPQGYVGAFDFNVVMLGQPQSRLVALIPRDVDPASIFESGRNEIRFNPGKSTIFLAAHFVQAENDEMYEAMDQIAAREGDAPALEPVFIEAGGRKVAAFRGVSQNYGAEQTILYTFLDDGRMLFATGPREGFDDAAVGRVLASLVATHPANALLYEHPKLGVELPPSNDPCGIPGLGTDFDVVAIKITRGSQPLDVAIDQSGNDVSQEDVVVGTTPRPVVLLLMGQEPIVWNIGQTEGARIAGVLAQGARRQVVIGLSKSTPLTTYSGGEGSNTCRYFYPSGDEPDMDVKRRVRAMFGRRIGTFTTQKSGAWFAVGDVAGAPSYSSDVTLQSVALPDDVLPGAQKGIDRLVSQSKLRLATDAEVDEWIKGAAQAANTPVEQFRRDMDWRLTKGQVYVVLSPFNLPESMGGANARSFILPAGTTMPGGPKGHNTFLVMSGFACEGVGCPP